MALVDVVGYSAGAITSITFLPQVIKTWKEKSAKNVSLLMFIIAIVNEVLWIAYGIMLNNWVIILTNSIIITMSTMMVVLKLKYKEVAA